MQTAKLQAVLSLARNFADCLKFYRGHNIVKTNSRLKVKDIHAFSPEALLFAYVIKSIFSRRDSIILFDIEDKETY